MAQQNNSGGGKGRERETRVDGRMAHGLLTNTSSRQRAVACYITAYNEDMILFS
jgi:hypothetical protein